mgnify:FL=1
MAAVDEKELVELDGHVDADEWLVRQKQFNVEYLLSIIVGTILGIVTPIVCYYLLGISRDSIFKFFIIVPFVMIYIYIVVVSKILANYNKEKCGYSRPLSKKRINDKSIIKINIIDMIIIKVITFYVTASIITFIIMITILSVK